MKKYNSEIVNVWACECFKGKRAEPLCETKWTFSWVCDVTVPIISRKEFSWQTEEISTVS